MLKVYRFIKFLNNTSKNVVYKYIKKTGRKMYFVKLCKYAECLYTK